MVSLMHQQTIVAPETTSGSIVVHININTGNITFAGIKPCRSVFQIIQTNRHFIRAISGNKILFSCHRLKRLSAGAVKGFFHVCNNLLLVCQRIVIIPHIFFRPNIAELSLCHKQIVFFTISIKTNIRCGSNNIVPIIKRFLSLCCQGYPHRLHHRTHSRHLFLRSTHRGIKNNRTCRLCFLRIHVRIQDDYILTINNIFRNSRRCCHRYCRHRNCQRQK